jgi:hypothetical protein
LLAPQRESRTISATAVARLAQAPDDSRSTAGGDRPVGPAEGAHQDVDDPADVGVLRDVDVLLDIDDLVEVDEPADPDASAPPTGVGGRRGGGSGRLGRRSCRAPPCR